ncbi:MAG TPA: hypothetical protein VFB08_08545 [Burkholderiales bacterium]|nr:hypothetical protein [Burkholderiales bacterium]
MTLARNAAVVLLALAAGSALGQLRTVPADAPRGEVRHVRGMTIAIDGAERQLAPGAQIRNAANLIIVPSAIPEGALAKYVVDADGMVRQVWLLTPQEASQPDKR